MEGLELTNVPRGVLGLVTDQEYGLLTYSPVYLLAAVGCWVMLRRRDTRWQTIGLLATTGAFVASVTQYYMWWGGFSVPARFLVPVLPLLAPMIAVAIDQHRGAAGRGLVGLLLALSVGSLVAVVYDPAAMLMFNDRDGTGRLVELLQGGIDLTAVLPTFLQVEWMEQLPRVSTWLVAAVVSVAAVTFVGAGEGDTESDVLERRGWSHRLRCDRERRGSHDRPAGRPGVDGAIGAAEPDVGVRRRTVAPGVARQGASTETPDPADPADRRRRASALHDPLAEGRGTSTDRRPDRWTLCPPTWTIRSRHHF